MSIQVTVPPLDLSVTVPLQKTEYAYFFQDGYTLVNQNGDTLTDQNGNVLTSGITSTLSTVHIITVPPLDLSVVVPEVT